MLDREGRLRDLSYVLDDIGPEHLSPIDLDILSSIEPNTLPPVEGAPVLEPPLNGVGRVFMGREALQLQPLGPDEALVFEGDIYAGYVAAVGASSVANANAANNGAWAGCYCAALVDRQAGWIAFGPWLVSTGEPLPLVPIQARLEGSGREGHMLSISNDACASALLAASNAVVGDLVFVGEAVAPGLASGTFAVDGMGLQRHASANIP